MWPQLDRANEEQARDDDDGHRLAYINAAADDDTGHDGQNDEPQDVVPHGGTEHDMAFARPAAPKLLQHIGGNADTGRTERCGNEQVGVQRHRRLQQP